MLPLHWKKRLQRLHEQCARPYEQDTSVTCQTEQKKTLQLTEINRKRKEQEQLDASATDDSLSESSNDMDSDYIPPSSDSSEDEKSSHKDDLKKRRGKPRETNTTSPTKNLTNTAKHHLNKNKSDGKLDYSTDEEESEILSQRTSTPQPSEKLKRMGKKRSSKRKRSETVLERAQDSGEEPDNKTQRTSTSQPPEKLKKTKKTAMKPKKIRHCKLWSSAEKAAVWRQLGQYITSRKAPGKELYIKALKAEPVLARRTWRHVKYQVYNFIKYQKKKEF